MALTIPPSSFDNPNDPDVGRKAAVYYFERYYDLRCAENSETMPIFCD